MGKIKTPKKHTTHQPKTRQLHPTITKTRKRPHKMDIKNDSTKHQKTNTQLQRINKRLGEIRTTRTMWNKQLAKVIQRNIRRADLMGKCGKD